MNTRRSFREFVRAELDGTCHNDPTYRAYDLTKLTGQRTIDLALRLLRMSLLEVEDDLVAAGLPRDDLKGKLARWCSWYKISEAITTKRPLKSRSRTYAGHRIALPRPDNPA